MAPKQKPKAKRVYSEHTTRHRPLRLSTLIGLKVEDDLKHAVDRDAARSDRSRSYVIRQILAQYYKLKTRTDEETAVT